jgi:hypothetical protein
MIAFASHFDHDCFRFSPFFFYLSSANESYSRVIAKQRLSHIARPSTAAGVLQGTRERCGRMPGPRVGGVVRKAWNEHGGLMQEQGLAMR